MNSSQIIVDESGVSSLLSSMTAQIKDVLSDSVVLVGIREGGDVIAERLAESLSSSGVTIDAVGALDITLYRDDFGHREHWPDVRSSEISVNLENKTVLLVDDVIFTGRTIRAALSALLDYGRPEKILLAVLIDRGYRQLPIQPDIVGRVLDIDRDLLCVARFKEQGDAADGVILEEVG